VSRRENSAEHSWHLALGLLLVAHELNLEIELHKALVMAPDQTKKMAHPRC